jgi:hypothetical protein
MFLFPNKTETNENCPRPHGGLCMCTQHCATIKSKKQSEIEWSHGHMYLVIFNDSSNYKEKWPRTLDLE